MQTASTMIAAARLARALGRLLALQKGIDADVTPPPVVGKGGLQFQEAIAWHVAREPRLNVDWKGIPREERRRAFGLANVTQLDLVTEVHKAVEHAVANGTTLADFKKEVGEKLLKEWAGSVKDPANRLETIFRNNVQAAYNAGRYMQATEPETLKRRPYWRFDGIKDPRQSRVCRPLNGTIRRADDPWWKRRIPPLHHRCRSRFTALTEVQAKKAGLTTDDKLSQQGPQEGFGHPPEDRDAQFATLVKQKQTESPPALAVVAQQKEHPTDPNARQPDGTWAHPPADAVELDRRLRVVAHERYGAELTSASAQLHSPEPAPGGAHRTAQGQIEMSPGLSRPIERAMAAPAGTQLSGEESNALTALLHEHLHGLGQYKPPALPGATQMPPMQAAYVQRYGRALEEGAVELAAVRDFRSVFGTLGFKFGSDGPGRAWQDGSLTVWGGHAYRDETAYVETLCRYAAGERGAGSMDGLGDAEVALQNLLHRWDPRRRSDEIARVIARHAKDEEGSALAQERERIIRRIVERAPRAANAWFGSIGGIAAALDRALDARDDAALKTLEAELGLQ